MGTQRERISDQLRQAILSAPLNCNQLSGRLGIHRSTLSRFVNGERGLPLELIDHIGELLGLRLVVDGNPEATIKQAPSEPAGRRSTPSTKRPTTKRQSRPTSGKRKDK